MTAAPDLRTRTLPLALFTRALPPSRARTPERPLLDAIVGRLLVWTVQSVEGLRALVSRGGRP